MDESTTKTELDTLSNQAQDMGSSTEEINWSAIEDWAGMQPQDKLKENSLFLEVLKEQMQNTTQEASHGQSSQEQTPNDDVDNLSQTSIFSNGSLLSEISTDLYRRGIQLEGKYPKESFAQKLRK